jgi:hypothetical protein
LTAVVAYLTIPSDYHERKSNGVKMDWLGSAAVVRGLILVVFPITQSSHASNGWAAPYIPVTLTLGVLILSDAFYIEGWVAEQPLLPSGVFRIKHMRPSILGLLFAYGTLGIYSLYATL